MSEGQRAVSVWLLLLDDCDSLSVSGTQRTADVNAVQQHVITSPSHAVLLLL